VKKRPRKTAPTTSLDVVIKELGHEVEGFRGFGKFEVIPVGVRESFEDDELGVNSSAKKSAVEESRVAEKKVTRAGDEESGRHALEVGVDGGQDGISAVGVAGVFLPDGRMGILGLESSGESVQREELVRVGGMGIVGEDGEKAEGAGKWKVKLLEAHSSLGRENGSGGSAKDADVARLVSLEEFLVDRDDVVDSGGEGIFWSEAVVDGDHFDPGEIADGRAFDNGAGVGIEAAAVKIDEDTAAVVERSIGSGYFRWGNRKGSEDVGGDTGDVGGFQIDGEEAASFGGLLGAPFVGALAASGEIFRSWSRFGEGGEPLLRFGADGGGHGHDTRDVRGAVGVEGGGIFSDGDRLHRFVATECRERAEQDGSEDGRSSWHVGNSPGGIVQGIEDQLGTGELFVTAAWGDSL
jgi:hypothetical protein